MSLLRTCFKKDIMCEFLPPNRPSNRVIIFCSGMPGFPWGKEAMRFWAKKGFWVFLPRYRGTWESGGEFLKRSPHEDILDVIDGISKGFVDLWSGNSYKLSAKSPARTDTARSGGYKLFIFGGSFGGPSAILCSRDPRVTKAVAFAPVIDWEAPSKDEPMDKLGAFLPKGFGSAYRFSKENWLRLSRNKLYSPISLISSPSTSSSPRGGAESARRRSSGGGVSRLRGGVVGVDGAKLLIFHAKDDTDVAYGPTKRFAKKTGAKLVTLRTGGHFGFYKSLEPRIYKQIRKFIS